MFRSFWHISKQNKDIDIDIEKDYGPSSKELRHFDKDDFACPCCGKNKTPLWFMKEIDDCRNKTGFPWIITSACRCEKHNKNIEGSGTSSHLTSANEEVVAVDIFCDNDEKRFKMIEQLRLHGFKRFGIGINFIHTDKDNKKNQERIWVY